MKKVIIKENFIFKTQVKTLNNLNFIYCFGEKITFLNNTSPCPEFVFTLPDSINFFTDTYKFERTNFDFVENFNSPDISPQIIDSNSFRYLPHHNQKENPKAKILSFFLIGVLITFISLLLLVLILIKFFLKIEFSY